MSEVSDSRKVHGYMPRELNIYEPQILKDWEHTGAVIGLIDGWVRTIAIATDLKTAQVDKIVDEITDHVRLRREDMLSPIAVIDEVRQKMTDYGLTP